jgi:hypothetical protein
LLPAALKFSITALRALNGCLYGLVIVGVVDGQVRPPAPFVSSLHTNRSA